MLSQSTSVRLSGQTCLIPEEKFGPTIWQRANSFWNPIGPTPGEATVLMTRSALDNIIGQRTHTLLFDDNWNGTPRPVQVRNLYLKTASGVFTQAASGGQVYLVELTDPRGVAARFSDSGSIQVNVRSWAAANNYLDGTVGDGDSPRSWQDLIGALWDRMTGLLGPFPGIPRPPAGAPENWRFNGMSAYDGLNEVLAHLGWALRFVPASGTFGIVQLGRAGKFPRGLPDPIRDDRPFLGGSFRLPGTIRVYFTNWYKSYGQERDTETDDNWSAAEQGGQPGVGIFVDIQTQNDDAGAGTILPLWDDLQVELDEDNRPTNLLLVSSRANDVARKYIRDAGNLPTYGVFPGIIGDFIPDGTRKAVTWRAWGIPNPGNEGNGGTATEIVEHPGLPIGRNHTAEVSAATGYGMAWRPVFEPMAPPDIARKSFPNFPRLANVLRVTSPDENLSEYVSSNDDGLFKAEVVRWVAGELQTLESCWIRFVDDHDNKLGGAEVMNGSLCGPGRLSGVETSEAGGTDVLLPIYTVTRPMTYCITVTNSGDIVNTCAQGQGFLPMPFDTEEINIGTISANPFIPKIFELDIQGRGAGSIAVHGKGLIEIAWTLQVERSNDPNVNSDDIFEGRITVNGVELDRSKSFGIIDDTSAFSCAPDAIVESDIFFATATRAGIFYMAEAEDVIQLEYRRIGGQPDHLYTGKGKGRPCDLSIKFVNSFDVYANPIDP